MIMGTGHRVINFKVCWISKPTRWPRHGLQLTMSWVGGGQGSTRCSRWWWSVRSGGVSASGQAYLLKLLSGLKRKNSWSITEQAGDLGPDGMQRLLNFYRAGFRHCPRRPARLCAGPSRGPASGVVADETGFLEKGTKSAGSSVGTPAPPGGSRAASWARS